MSLDPLLEEAGLSADEVLEWAKKRADALLEQAHADPELAELAQGLEAGEAVDAAAQARVAGLEAGEPLPSTVDTERVKVVERAAAKDANRDGDDANDGDMEELDFDDVEELDDDMLELIDEDENGDDGDPDSGEGAELARALIDEVSTGQPAVRTGKTQRNPVVVADIANDGPPPPPSKARGPSAEDSAAAPVVTGDTNIQTPVAAAIPAGDDDLPDELRDELADEALDDDAADEALDDDTGDEELDDDLDDLEIDLDD